MSIYRRKRRDGTLAATYTADFEFQKVRIAEDTGATTKAEALKWVTAKRREILEDRASSRSIKKRSGMTLKEAMGRYVDEQLRKSSNYETSAKYVVDKLLKEIGPDVRLEDFSTALLKPVITRKEMDGLAPSTIRREIGILKAMHNHARDIWEYPSLKPVAWRKLSPSGGGKPIILPPLYKIRELVEAATPRMALVIEFAVLTGLRLHEIRKVRVQDFDPEQRTLHFSGKGKKEVNHPLSTAAVRVIASSLELQRRSAPTSPHLLTQQGQSSKLFDTTNLRREWTDAKRRVGLSSMRFHDLRHVFATLMEKAAKGDPLTLMKAMRHSDVDTSLLYVHADNSRVSKSLEAVAEALSTASPKPSKPALVWKSDEPGETPTGE